MQNDFKQFLNHLTVVRLIFADFSLCVSISIYFVIITISSYLCYLQFTVHRSSFW
jgi:hypothetical protein